MIAFFVLVGGLVFCFVSGYVIGVDLARQEAAEERALAERRRGEPPATPDN